MLLGNYNVDILLLEKSPNWKVCPTCTLWLQMKLTNGYYTSIIVQPNILNSWIPLHGLPDWVWWLDLQITYCMLFYYVILLEHWRMSAILRGCMLNLWCLVVQFVQFPIHTFPESLKGKSWILDNYLGFVFACVLIGWWVHLIWLGLGSWAKQQESFIQLDGLHWLVKNVLMLIHLI